MHHLFKTISVPTFRHIYGVLGLTLGKPSLLSLIASPFIVLIFTVKIKFYSENATEI